MAGSSEVTPIEASINAAVEFTTSTNDPLNDTGENLYFDVNGVDASKLLIIVQQDTISGSGTPGFLVKDGAHYSGGTVGDLEVATTAMGEYVLVLETARFKDSDGHINLQLATSGDTAAPYVRGVLLP